MRIGKKRVAKEMGIPWKGAKLVSFQQVTKVINGLKDKGCIIVGDLTREGTLYTVIAPRDIPFVKEKMATPAPTEDDYFTEPDKRRNVFERDKWTCQYCGETVSADNVTLDHYIPQSKGGGHLKENLRTCCLVCNSIKSGKSFEEAAPLILKSMQERRQRNN
jgi:hypothetical protein